MNHEFKAGDQAVIVGAYSRSENIGKVCELVELLAPEQISHWRDPADGQRAQNGDVREAWLVIGDGIASYNGDDGFVLAAPHHLMPLRGNENPDTHLATSAPRQAVTV